MNEFVHILFIKVRNFITKGTFEISVKSMHNFFVRPTSRFFSVNLVIFILYNQFHEFDDIFSFFYNAMNITIFLEFNTFFVQYHILISRIFWNFTANRVEIMHSVVFHSVDFMKFLYHDFLKKFRENNFFSKEFTI